MQRQKYSKILQSDYDGMSDRAPGMPILQRHGNLVSRGDLITQDNISIPNPNFNITINNGNFSQLCTVGNPGQLVNYNINEIINTTPFPITGSISTDQDGIYASSAGSQSGTGWNGPMFYTLLPDIVGLSNKYWRITTRFTITGQSSQPTMIQLFIRFGYTSLIWFEDRGTDITYELVSLNAKYLSVSQFNNQSRRYLYYSGEMNNDDYDYTISFTHYTNNITKVILNGSTLYNAQDPFQYNTGSNLLLVQICTNDDKPITTHRIKYITITNQQ